MVKFIRTSKKAFNNITLNLILEIISLILKLILSGKSKEDAFRSVSDKFNIPVCMVKKYWKKYRVFQ